MTDLMHADLMLKIAQKDLKALAGMKADRETFDDTIFGFHAQQAVEKTVKAWLSLARIEYPRTHDLNRLFQLLAQHGINIDEKFTDLVDLTNFAVQFRYEFFEDLGTELDRIELINQISDLLKYVERLIEIAKD